MTKDRVRRLHWLFWERCSQHSKCEQTCLIRHPGRPEPSEGIILSWLTLSVYVIMLIGPVSDDLPMKRSFLFVPFALILAFVLLSCEKETILSVDQQLLTFTEEGGSQILSLTANKPWTVSSDQSWCKVTPTAGEEAASSRISVNCDPNTTYDTRYCNITFTCAELVKTVSVTQDESDGMLISPTEFDLSNDAQQISIEVKANVKFTVAVDDACKSWIRHSATKGLTTSTVILDISKNEDYDGREGHVTISQTDGSLFSTIKIKQSQNNGLFITTPEYELSNESHQLSVEVKSNISFEVTSGASWIKYVETKSLNSSFIVLDIEANQDYDKREGKVIVKQKGGGLEGVITVKQDQNYGLIITQTEYELSNEAQTIDVEIKHNVEFDVVIPADCKGWISKVTTKGLETNTMTFSIAKNDTYDNRVGSITFKQKNGSLSGTVKVVQAQTDGIQVEKEAYSIDSKGGSIEVKVKANVDYETIIDDAAKDWLSVVKTKALNPSKITISVAVNEDEQPREGKVYVKQANGSAEASFIVKQAGKNTITAAFHVFAASSVGDSFCVDVESTVEFDIVIPKDATWLTQVITKAPTTKTLSFQVATNKTTKSRVATIQFVNTKEGLLDTLRVEQNPVNEPVNDEILYTSTDGNTVIPYRTDAFGAEIISNTIVDGKGSIRFSKPLGAIGEKAFYNRTNLISVILPFGLKRLDNNSFDNCFKMESIVIPMTVMEIGSEAFLNCQKLKSIELPQGFQIISRSMFDGCKSLAKILIPDSVTKIYEAAFRNCSSLTEINLPDGLNEFIHWYTFYGCSSLKKIVIPGGVQYLEYYAFQYCSSLEEVIIHEGLERIEWDCFWGCSNLKKVKLPSSLTYISSSVFRECTSLITIEIPEGVTRIGDSCFLGCTSLVSISFPEGITTLESNMFRGCTKLIDVNLPTGINAIEEGAFMNCSSLSFFSIPEGVNKISNNSFNGCKSLKSISIPSSVTSIGQSAFSECGLTSVTVPNNVVEIGTNAFYYCGSLKSITLPNGLTTIANSTFDNCLALETIDIPASVKTIEHHAFYHSGLKTVTFHEGLNSIGDQAFDWCESLSAIKIPSSVTSLGTRAFCNCISMTSANIPKGIKVINVGLFNGCRSLKAIEIPDSVERIEADAFNYCLSLTTVTVPEKVTFLGTNVFHSCIGLTKATVLPKTPPVCENNGAFYNTSECPIYVPKASVDAYKKAEFWKDWAHRIQAIP